MRIHLAGVAVDDQQKALRFYTETLGFQLKHNIPLGEYAWITVVSPEAPEGTQFVLEPEGHPAVRPYKKALVDDGIPWTSFAVDDVKAEHERLTARGVRLLSKGAMAAPPQNVSAECQAASPGHVSCLRERLLRCSRMETCRSAPAMKPANCPGDNRHRFTASVVAKARTPTSSLSVPTMSTRSVTNAAKQSADTVMNTAAIFAGSSPAGSNPLPANVRASNCPIAMRQPPLTNTGCTAVAAANSICSRA